MLIISSIDVDLARPAAEELEEGEVEERGLRRPVGSLEKGGWRDLAEFVAASSLVPIASISMESISAEAGATREGVRGEGGEA